LKKKRRIIFAVFDPLYHEYRGYKTALSFLKFNYDVKVIGIKYHDDILTGWDDVSNHRVRVYEFLPLSVNIIIFWIKLFFTLLKERSDMYYSHDIFPMMPVFLASRIKRVHYVYDAHEFWHGNSQIEDRPAAKIFWTFYEKLFIGSARKVLTVSAPIAKELESIYKIRKVGVFTNLPVKKDIPEDRKLLHRSLGIPENMKIVLYQGHFLINNGLETVIRAFGRVDEKAVLVLIGSGSEEEKLRQLSGELNLSQRIYFTGPYPHGELIKYTVCADIGLCLIKNFGKSFYYSTPNKMFEFIQARVPQIASDFPEMSRFVSGYEVGEVTDPEDEVKIAETLNGLLADENKWNKYSRNCIKASEELIWDNYEEELVGFIK